VKKLLILLFSLLISFNSYGEWEEVGESPAGNTYYINTDTIKEHNGYVYYWVLDDYLKPDKYGDMSVKTYVQGDCGVNRFKWLSFIYYKQPMGEESVKTEEPNNTDWIYRPPESIGGGLLKYVCDYVD
jgi:hypothetical protein